MDTTVAHVLDAAGRAPSPHNTQPWRLRARPGLLEVWMRDDCRLPAVDPEDFESLHAMGALLENVLLTLDHLGHAVRYDVAERLTPGVPVITVRWGGDRRPDAVASDATLHRMIAVRRTSRLAYADEPIPDHVVETLRRHVRRPCACVCIRERAVVSRLRELTARAAVRQLERPDATRELRNWLRFSRRDDRWYSDGLTAECLGWRRGESLAARLVLVPPVLRALRTLRLHGQVLGQVDQHAPATPALMLLTVLGDGPAARVEAGRTLQRLWLAAAAHGLWTHPLSVLIDDPETQPHVRAVFETPPDHGCVCIFRLGAGPTPPRSPRRSVDEICC